MKISQIVLELLIKCNFRCPYCRDNSGTNKTLPLAAARSIITELQPLGIRKIQLDGGEPLLYGDLRSLIEFVVSEGLEVGIYTNAALIDEGWAEYLSRVPRLKLAVTLHPLNPPKDLDATFRGIAALKVCGVFPRLVMVVGRESLAMLPNVLGRVEDCGYTLVLNPLVLSGRAFDNQMQSLSDEGRLTLARIVEDARSKRRRTEIVDNASVEEQGLQIEKIQLNEQDEFALHINTDGEALPFFSADASTSIGNTKDLDALKRRLSDPQMTVRLLQFQLAMKRRLQGRDRGSRRRIDASDVETAANDLGGVRGGA